MELGEKIPWVETAVSLPKSAKCDDISAKTTYIKPKVVKPVHHKAKVQAREG